jgi:hypothetical protein
MPLSREERRRQLAALVTEIVMTNRDCPALPVLALALLIEPMSRYMSRTKRSEVANQLRDVADRLEHFPPPQSVERVEAR